MTSRILAAASLGVLMLLASQAQAAWPPVQSSADRGANAHYIYRQGGWHRVDESLPQGERAGAESYPYAKPAGEHFEIPDNSPGADYQNDGTLSDYRRQHSIDNMTGMANRRDHYYDGRGYLPEGTWTGDPLQPYVEPRDVTMNWKADSQGRIRKDEISGTAYVIQPPSPAPVKGK